MKKDYSEMEYHPFTEKIAGAMKKKNPAGPMGMYRALLGYFFCKAASTMRAKIKTEVRGTLPINAFLINLVPSGVGKNYSINMIEKGVLKHFKKIFLDQVLPIVADEHIAKIAVRRAYIAGEDPDDMKAGVLREYENLGKMRFSFQKATAPAIQQLRQKLLIANAGALNLEIDEIGMNLLASNEALSAYLELFDIGEAKEALTKNTKENTRIEEIDGTTPANLLAIGTPCKVFDGSKVEENFNELEETGLARRCWTFYMDDFVEDEDMTGAEMYALQSSKDTNDVFKDAAVYFSKLANVTNFGREIILTKDVGIELFEYHRDCKRRAAPYRGIEETVRAEMEHRYFKVLKLAGAFAYVDGHAEISMENLYAAIKLAEDSGESFYNMFHQDPPYAKMARYLAQVPNELTQSDLIEKLPYYKKASVVLRRDMVTNAISWGYKNHIVVKQYMQEGVEFFKGSSLTETNLDKLKVAHSQSISDGYKNDLAPFDKLHVLTQLKNHHWINHRSTNGHRDEDHMIPGFNMVVLDIDKGAKLDIVQSLLKDYKFMAYTTKRHTPENNRFRLIMPLNYEMSMTAEEYRAFMRNIFEWLPFEVDTAAIDRCRKWLTNDAGQYIYNHGDQLLDARLFIAKTRKNDERKQQMVDFASLSNLERWFVQGSFEGNRNNRLLRYAMLLVDMGFSYPDIREKVMGLNSSMPDKLSEKEIDTTILVTATTAIGKRAAKQAA